MKLSIDPALVARHPEYRMFTVVATGADNRGTDEELARRLAEAQEAVTASHGAASHGAASHGAGDLAANPRLEAWREAFRRFDADPAVTRPSLEAMLERLASGHDLPFVNKLVAISNLVSLKHLLPAGGDDLTRIEGDFGLRLADGLESFTPIGGQGQDPPQRPEPGEVIYADQQKVLCRKWIWRQADASKITESTRHAALNVDVLPPATVEEGQAAAEEMARLIERYCGGTIEIVCIGGKTQSLALRPQVTARVTRERLRDDSIRRLVDAEGSRLSDSADTAEWSIHDLMQRSNVESVVVEKELVPILDRGERIKIYQGFDPTSPDLHVGHLVSLRVLRWFQLRGHHVIFLIGDATALIGDPSGRDQQRKMLTPEQVARNQEMYQQQAGQVLQFEGGSNPVQVLRNSEWLLPLDLGDILRLMSEITAQRLLERNMFQVRMKKGEPLFYVETLYPLLQGYDSVAMEVDAELGGKDQLFNMLVGRTLAKSYLGRTKHVLTTPLLAGFDGRKMSKTYGNTVNLTAAAFDLFDGVMRVHDDLILTYARLLTDLRWSDLARLEAELADDPLAVKERVAYELVLGLRGESAARKAQAEFIDVRRRGDVPRDLPVATLPPAAGDSTLIDLLSATEPPVADSKSELRRLIRQGGLSLAGRRVEDELTRFTADELQGQVLRLGKKRFFKLSVRAADRSS